MSNIKFIRYLPHYLRKRFDQKIIVIESDDWGLERGMTDDSINYFRKKYTEEKLSRWTYDALETKNDLGLLFDLLGKYKNKFEYPPVITANFITHNIDYTSKEELNFIPLSKGFNFNSEDVRDVYKTGIENNYIYPQLHGYSHYNLTELRKFFQTEEGQESFEIGYLTGKSTVKGNLKLLTGELCKENNELKIKESYDEFKNTFNFKSDTLIPPTFILDEKIIESIKTVGVKMLQSSNRLVQSNGKRYSKPFYRKKNGLIWAVRNARLDPHSEYGFYYEQCLEEIEKAFGNNMPAVIDFHRVNISGKFKPEYRDKTLSEMIKLFDSVYEKWPDVKFMNSSDLNKMIWQQETK